MQRKSVYDQIYDGEWCTWNLRRNKLQCCDCGLVHVVDYRVRDGKVESRFERDERATQAVRRNRGIRVVKGRKRNENKRRRKNRS